MDPVNISVRENRIGSAAFVEDDVPVAVEGLKRYRTIEGLFDLLQEGIDKNAHTISAEYHSELGYPIKGSIMRRTRSTKNLASRSIASL